jgi:hypothetical protein
MTRKKKTSIVACVLFVVASAIVVIPNLIRVRNYPFAGHCINNLQEINLAKERWALEHDKTPNDIPSWEDIRSCFMEPWTNTCPEGGAYTLGRMDQLPKCSIGKFHSLEP